MSTALESPSAPASDYRARFYSQYRSTHVGPRKGEATAKAHAKRFSKWDRLLGPCLPESKDAPVADLGCGSGPILAWLVHKGYSRAVGVDVSAEEVAAARALGLPVEQAELTEFLRGHPHEFGFIILRNVIEHFYKHEILDILSAAQQALTPSGSVFIQVPNGESPFGMRIRYGDFTHETAFTRTSIAQVLRVCGFREINVGPIRTGGWRARLAARIYQWLLKAELGADGAIVTQDLFAVARC